MISFSDLRRFIAPLENMFSILIMKSIVTNSELNQQGATQRVQVDLGNEQLLDGVERIQPHGLSSNPRPGAEAIVLCLAGNRDHPIVIQVDNNETRVLVNGGDVALYNDFGMVIELRGEEILLGKGKQETLTPLDGVVTGQTIDTFTGIPLGALPGGNDLGTANSQKLKVQL